MKPITEDTIEYIAIAELKSLGWGYAHGNDIAPDGVSAERESFEQVVLTKRLMDAVRRLNPGLPEHALQQAVQMTENIHSQNLLHNNETFHGYLVEKVRVPYMRDGFNSSYEVQLIDFQHPERNDYLAVNQFTVTEQSIQGGRQTKRPDIVLFINGLPVGVLELKNAVDEHATLEHAYRQIQTYKTAIPGLFTYNCVCIISDGMDAKAGSLTADSTRFMAWKTADGKVEASKLKPQLTTLIRGMLKPQTLLDIIRNFIVFQKAHKEDTESGQVTVRTEKILAGYHQYYAVNKAVASSLTARAKGSKKGGVVWHTQGSGKSLSMVFYAGKMITAERMENPTIVVITDRNDLDDQLFDTFAGARQLLRQEPVQAASRGHLKQLLKVASGGIVFSTIQKFLPEDKGEQYDLLSDRDNIIVIADEAHRTQYGFEAVTRDVKDETTRQVTGKRITYGFAKYMRDALPNATYIGFTGTPIESTDINTPQVFGNYIDIYDISRSIEDGATVRIFYESRLAQVTMTEEGKQLIEELDAELEAQDEVDAAQKVKAKWTQLEAIVGHEKRLRNVAKDIVSHFEKRTETLEGKGMVVTMSRSIAVHLYREIIALRPDWHDPDLGKGRIKVVMTANSADGPEMAMLHTTKEHRRVLADRMKNPDDPLQMVIVIDMWLTGFDVPCLHTMYIDKPMQGHSLMQAIARVNRVFRDKPGGLIVDYLGIASDLKKALSFYSDSGGKGKPTEELDQAFNVLLEKSEVVRQMFDEESSASDQLKIEEPAAYYGNSTRFHYKRFFTGSDHERLAIVLQAQEHILGLKDGKERFIREVTLLSKAYALCKTHGEAEKYTTEIAFFQAVKGRLAKFEGAGSGSAVERYESAIRIIVSQAISSDTVLDVFEAAGIEKPELSILSDKFLKEVEGMKHKNLAFELLRKLLHDEIRVRMRKNLVVSKKLMAMLDDAIRKYRNNLLSTAEIIEELIRIAREMKSCDEVAKSLGLTEDEIAFYNALEVNDSAVQVLGDAVLRDIAKEIAEKVRRNAAIDWTVRVSARAKLMVIVRRTLKKYGYPPDKQEKAIETVLQQAELAMDSAIDN